MPKWTNEQYDAISKSGTNIIVSAGAGSGKTEVLSERVIEKLRSGIHIDELLVLTFTKAAAEEMKDRIRSKIKKDESLKEELIRIESSYITTFDSFALSIVKKSHYLVNIKKDIDITDNSILTLVKTNLLDEVFMELYEEKNEDFLKLIDKYCVKNDKDLRSTMMSLIDNVDGVLNKDEYINFLDSALFNDEIIEKNINCFISLFESKKKAVLKCFEELKLYFDEKYIKKVEEVILKVINCDYDDFVRLSPLSIPPYPRNTDDEEAISKKEKLNNAFKDLMLLKQYGTKKELKDDILSTKNDVHTICMVIKRYFNRLNAYKENNDIYSFQDIASLAIHILKNFDSARNEIKYSIKEIMIDEYQDTNDIQEEFISLIANDNVYMVGDVKQSIYQFRGSNPSIFKEKYDKYSKGLNGIKIDLVKNFRSREEVLKNINDIFSLIMNKTLGGADYASSHAMCFGNDNYRENKDDVNYNFEVLEYEQDDDQTFSKAEIEIFTIARDIQSKINSKFKVFDKKTSKLRLFTYSDAVIIIDRSKYFDDYKRVFEYLNIPLTILKDGKLNASTDVELIKNIIDFIIHLKNNIYDSTFKFDFMSIGRSFLYEYSDEYLFDIISQNKYNETTIYQDFDCIKSINSYNPYRLYQFILDKTDFYNKIYKVGDYENTSVRLSALGEVARSYSEKGFTIEAFLKYLDEIIKRDLKIEYKEWSNAGDSVKIMTVHKSKGLEFPVCYFADLDHKFNDDELKLKFIADKRYGLITPLDGDKENFMKLLYKNDYRINEIGEKIRLFYVSLTRAKEKFIIVLPESNWEKKLKDDDGTIDYEVRKNVSKLSDFVYMTKPYLTKYFRKIELESLGLTKNYLYSNTSNIFNEKEMVELTVDEISIVNEKLEEKQFSKDSLDLIDKNVYKMMEYGSKVHKILEYTDFKNYDEKDIHDDIIGGQITKFVGMLGDITTANIYKEYEFYYEKDNVAYHGIIDLIVEYDDHIAIIDYKLSNIQDENYKKQLTGYKNYVSSISSKPIVTYLYSIYGGTLEQVVE